MSANSLQRSARRPGLWALLCLLALTAGTAQAVDLATGLTGAIGVAHDTVNNRLYFVDFNAGTLRRIDLTPDCEAGLVACAPSTVVVAGLSHPEDVAVNAAAGMAYVTTRDAPGTGALVRVNLATSTRSTLTFNLGAPHQVVLGSSNSAYLVGFTSGRLYQVNLTTGVRMTVVSGLDHPIGLAVKADHTRAFIAEQAAAGGRIREIDLVSRTIVRTVVSGLTSPFYLAFTDPAEIGLYVAERSPANRISRVDLLAGTSLVAASGLPALPSGLAVNLAAGALYVGTDPKVVRIGLTALPMEPVFLGVGHVPSTSIDNGYATTAPGYFFQVRDAPFGGTLNVFGNLNNFRALGASHYRVLVEREGAGFVPLTASWTTYRWNTTTLVYDPVVIAPVTGTDRYEIPPEYPAAPQRWYPTFLMVRWPTALNGRHELRVELYSSAVAPSPLPSPAGNSLIVQVDNTAPNVELHDIRRHGTGIVIAPCEIVSPPVPNSFDFRVTASDANHHMLSYGLTALWGRNQSATVFADSYSAHIDAEGANFWSGVSNAILPAAGWPASCNCAHTFILEGWKRTIDGYNYILYGRFHQSVTINNTGVTCP